MVALSNVYRRRPDPNSGAYRNIFNYNPSVYSAYKDTGGEAGYIGANGQEGLENWSPEEQNLKGILSQTYDAGLGSEDPGRGSGWRTTYDYSKLPNGGMTKMGRIGEGVIPIRSKEELNSLVDKRYVYFDPNYGLVSNQKYVKKSGLTKATDIAFPLVIGSMLGGAGGALGTAVASGLGAAGGSTGALLGSGLGKMGVGALTSGRVPGVGSLANLAGSYFGMPSWANGLASYGVNAALNRGRGG